VNLFVVYAYPDADYAGGLEDTLTGRGLVVGEPLALWPGQRLLPQIEGRLREARAAVVVSRGFLAFSWPREELDGLATRDQVVAILAGVCEADLSRPIPRLAVALFPVSLSDRLMLLLRPEGWGGWALKRAIAEADNRTIGNLTRSGRNRAASRRELVTVP
jgi:hypothetical protein